MPRKLRELRRDLRRAGATPVPAKGSHEKWTHPRLAERMLVLSGQDGDDAERYQEKDVRNFLADVYKAKVGQHD